jgi:hypothetical protein
MKQNRWQKRGYGDRTGSRIRNRTCGSREDTETEQAAGYETEQVAEEKTRRQNRQQDMKHNKRQKRRYGDRTGSRI